jgi:hypothetical protein
VPQAPSTGQGLFCDALQVTVAPPFRLAQVQLTVAHAAGNTGLLGVAVPGAQKVSVP